MERNEVSAIAFFSEDDADEWDTERHQPSSKPDKATSVAAAVETKEWPKGPHGTPNAFNRSSLFSAGGKHIPSSLPMARGRSWIEGALVASMPNYEILYTGPLLDQHDKRVFQHIASIMRERNIPAGGTLEIPGYALLLSMGKTDGKANYESLAASLKRLWEGTITFMKTASGSWTDVRMLITGGQDHRTKAFRIALHPAMSLLHEYDVAKIDLKRKAGLSCQLASFLHDFYSSHRLAVPFQVAELQRLSGRTCDSKTFRRELRRALVELENCIPPVLAPGSKIDRNNGVIAKKAELAFVVGPAQPTKVAIVPNRAPKKPAVKKRRAFVL
jgi:hypothetical protein